MVEMLVVVSIASLLAATIGALIALRIQHGNLDRMGAERHAWERAHSAHQLRWEIQQEKYAATLETRLTRQVQQIVGAWKEWEGKDQERTQALTIRFESAVAQRDMEHELARLPLIENIPLTSDAIHSHQYTLPNWRPPRLQDTNLSERDLSHRYLGQADLRNTQLSNANLYMADLSGAFLTGANLAGADLLGANLAGADLRDTTLSGTNLLMADLHRAILVGADLRGARNLTSQQVSNAIYDGTTLFDIEIDNAGSPLPDSQPLTPVSTSESVVTEKSFDVMSTNSLTSANETAEAALPTMPGERELLIPPQAEPPLSSPLPSDDSLLVPAVTDLPGDRQENIQTEVSNTAAPRPMRNGKKRAAVN